MNIERLPKWAQAEITRLQNENKELRQRLNEVQDGTGPMVWREMLHNVKHGIPTDAVVVVTVGGEEIEISVQYDSLRISSFTRSMVIQPQSSNVVRVRVADFW